MKTSAVNTCESLLAQQKGAFKLRYGCRVRPRGADVGLCGVVIGRRAGQAFVHWRRLNVLRWHDCEDLEVVCCIPATSKQND